MFLLNGSSGRYERKKKSSLAKMVFFLLHSSPMFDLISTRQILFEQAWYIHTQINCLVRWLCCVTLGPVASVNNNGPCRHNALHCSSLCSLVIISLRKIRRLSFLFGIKLLSFITSLRPEILLDLTRWNSRLWYCSRTRMMKCLLPFYEEI